MKKIGIMAVVVSLALSLAAFAGEKSGNAKAQTGQTQATQDQGAKKGKGKAPDAATLEKELASMKTEHQAAMAELREIKKLATEEKATKTAGALDKLMASREKVYQEKVAPIQKKLDALKAAQKGTDTTKDSTTETPKKKGRKNK